MTKTTNKKKKNNKRKLLLLLLLLFVTVLMLSTATYAWFTSNRKVSVEEIQVDVAATGGLEISVDARNWGIRVSKENLLNAVWDGDTVVPNNQMPGTLANVSSFGNVTNGRLDVFLGRTATNDDASMEYLSLNKESENDGSCLGNTGSSRCPDDIHFVAFDIFLKLDSDGQEHPDGVPIYLTRNSIVDESSPRGLRNGTRVAFITEGYVSLDDYYAEDYNYANIQEAQLASTTDGFANDKVFLWEPNSDVHTASAIDHAKKYYNIEVLGTGESAQAYQGAVGACTNIPLDYWNSTAGRDLTGIKIGENDVSNWNECFKAVTVDKSTKLHDASTKLRTDGAFEVLRIQPGVTKVRVYFWIEGNDIDTENMASASDSILNLLFSLDNV